ncbi:PAS domain S-box-containing protein [Andreprevotia lacus DSM 23236]|jgi:PAS domain S-box-containing protein|uniref:histidine kinase n=1 Tax=Andreprevotia lacus DSM 23236 TaxID=1121001 RepID=A0A1W1XGX6_9NEIS|nr:DUF3369 domain-containing protein [Andreprevotia lacus]SMC22778.1 PAS domain S-box-containing protein [Andreprevotia lacus DSM 23236]
MTASDEPDWLQPDSTPQPGESHGMPWKILIADDEPDIHTVTRLALGRLTFKQRPIRLLSAYSAAQAFDVLSNEPDVALIFLDVVMESEDAGLILAQRIRTELRNPFVRIVLRTGQPGVAKEQRVIVEYDINDYKEKTELTTQKLITATIASLRAYEAIWQVERGRQGLSCILRDAVNLHRYRSRRELAVGVLDEISRVLGTDIDGVWCTRDILCSPDMPLHVDAATGAMLGSVETDIAPATPAFELLWGAFSRRGHRLAGPDYVLYLHSNGQQECAVYFTAHRPLLDVEIELLAVLATQVTAALDNAWLYTNLVRENSERKQAEAALRKHAEEVFDLYNNAPCGYHSLDADGCIVDMNQTELGWLGYRRNEVVDRLALADLLDEADRPCLLANLQQLQQGQSSVEAEYRFHRKDGSIFPVQVTTSAVRGADGTFQKTRSTVYDITERKRIDEELDRYRNHLEILVEQRTSELKLRTQELEHAHNQLLQSEKMASIGQLAAGVAHEINNPISYVISNMGTLASYIGDLLRLIGEYEAMEPGLVSHPSLQLLRAQIELDYLREDAPALLGESNEGLRRVKKIVQDLKEFSHVGDTDWQLADLHHCLDSTLNIASHELKYKATVVKEYGNLPEVECLPLELNQVFMNILVNAGQAISEQGCINIRTMCMNGEARVEIADNGSGMTSDVLKRIFDPFFTTKSVGVGTGLGLSLSYGIVQKHHGRIEVNSAPGQGTTFTVCLPLRQIHGNPDSDLQ